MYENTEINFWKTVYTDIKCRLWMPIQFKHYKFSIENIGHIYLVPIYLI